MRKGNTKNISPNNQKKILSKQTNQQTAQSQRIEFELKQMQNQFDMFIRLKLTWDAQLLDPGLLQTALLFYAFSGNWLVKVGESSSKE